jgi:acyl carrier protein
MEREIIHLLDDTLALGGRSSGFTRDTPLLGALPELDSMAVLAVLTALEERFGIVFDDDGISAAVFATVGSLVDFVAARRAG